MHKRKKILSFLVFVCILLSGTVQGFAQEIPKVAIMVNNMTITEETESFNGILLGPAKELANAMGGEFSFDYVKLTGTIKGLEGEMKFRLDDPIASYNGKYFQMNAPMTIIHNRVMIPVEFTAKMLGAAVYLNPYRSSIMIFQPTEGNLIYRVASGDALWKISKIFGTSVDEIKIQNRLTTDMIYINQALAIKSLILTQTPTLADITKSATLRSGAGFEFNAINYLQAGTRVTVKGKKDDWYKVETPKGNGYVYYTVIQVLQEINDTTANSSYFSSNIPVDTSLDQVIYIEYIVQKGDYLWLVAEKTGVTINELFAANNLTSTSVLYPGQALKVPQYQIAIQETRAPQYGEILDWFAQGRYVFPINQVGQLTDVQTGKSFMVKRTIGASHSDTETLTNQDTQVMKEIFGGVWTWNRRAFILEVNGRRVAVSASGMPHAGVDGVPFLQTVQNRSDQWGTGPNYDNILGNGMDGHFDVYMLNSSRHVDNQIDPAHQYNVSVAGGLQ